MDKLYALYNLVFAKHKNVPFQNDLLVTDVIATPTMLEGWQWHFSVLGIVWYVTTKF